MDKRDFSNRLFDLYCHNHKHTTKVIGYPVECELCIKEKVDKMFIKRVEVKMRTKKEIIEELRKIRIRLTRIYYAELENPHTLNADTKLSMDINKLEKKYAQEIG